MSYYFQDIILDLQGFWKDEGCKIFFPYDANMGAGTFHPQTFFNSLRNEPISSAYVQPCRRPKDGRYGKNPNRWQKYYQFQVIISPSPENIQAVYLKSLEHIGIDIGANDIKFVEDDWESPTLGAWGAGWEVWLNGLEITQFTYFQQVGGIQLKTTPCELTYGLERIAMYIQNKQSISNIEWAKDLEYKDVHLKEEIDGSFYSFEHSDPKILFNILIQYENEAHRLLGLNNIFGAYDHLLKCSHTFNLLDARGAISVSQRANYIKRIRKIASSLAEKYLEYSNET
ncbi:glycine--tRNA ligase subunit alpha [bacterium]|nr:glycine--tRNA ligase subunit alpha [bacterium]